MVPGGTMLDEVLIRDYPLSADEIARLWREHQ